MITEMNGNFSFMGSLLNCLLWIKTGRHVISPDEYASSH
jgi:hypothetical protein